MNISNYQTKYGYIFLIPSGIYTCRQHEYAGIEKEQY